MLPLTLLATNKLIAVLTANDALSNAVKASAAAAGLEVAPLPFAQIIGTFLGPDLGDLDLQLTYPRVCIYTNEVVNNQREKFRSFSGVASLAADVWSSASLEQQTEMALHFYVDGIAALYGQILAIGAMAVVIQVFMTFACTAQIGWRRIRSVCQTDV